MPELVKPKKRQNTLTLQSTGQTSRSQQVNRWGALRKERGSWWSQWGQLSAMFLPCGARFFRSDRNRGDKRYRELFNNAPLRSASTLISGLMANVSSPARKWFDLSVPDQDLATRPDVRLWLDAVGQKMLRIFQVSNAYRSIHSMYEQLVVFGTSSMLVVEDYENVIQCYPQTCGEYAIGQTWEGRVNVIYREFERTVREVVEEFGFENCSVSVQSQFIAGDLDNWVPLIHAVEPREDRVQEPWNTHMPYRSVYFELDGDHDTNLRESGYEECPYITARWSVFGQDVYGSSPCMEALGDARQLQAMETDYNNAVEIGVDPPLQVPTHLKGQEVQRFAGGETFVDMPGPNMGIRPLFEANLDESSLLLNIQRAEERVREACYADLFLMMHQTDRRQITAREIAERHEEKLLMLGPVLERLHTEMLGPFIKRTFNIMSRNGVLPPAPEELQGMPLTVEFVSVLAQAQKMVGIQTVDRWLGTVGQLAQFRPEALDKVNVDKTIDEYAVMLGVPQKLIQEDEKIAKLRKARADANAAMQQADMEQTQAATAEKVAKAESMKVDSPAEVVSQVSGYSNPPPQAF